MTIFSNDFFDEVIRYIYFILIGINFYINDILHYTNYITNTYIYTSGLKSR